MKQQKVIIIVGPTASGKTSLSLQLAAHYKTSIISADSRQCFHELNIGVAKPPGEALHAIKHYFINSHSIHDVVNAQVFETYALNAAQEIFKKNDVAIVAGGTGMYIKAFCDGLDEIPEVELSLREQIINAYKEKGLAWLQQEVQEKDPGFWAVAEQQNPQRLMRALEVVGSTGRSITAFRNNVNKERPFNIIKIGIDISKPQLHANIEKRTDEMMAEGLVEEVGSLYAFKHINALQTVGYKEIFEYMEGKFSLAEAVNQIKINTRQYAKRQLTWFRKDKTIHWLAGGNLTGSDFERLHLPFVS